MENNSIGNSFSNEFNQNENKKIKAYDNIATYKLDFFSKNDKNDKFNYLYNNKIEIKNLKEINNSNINNNFLYN